jgi:hypothetical protein
MSPISTDPGSYLSPPPIGAEAPLGAADWQVGGRMYDTVDPAAFAADEVSRLTSPHTPLRKRLRVRVSLQCASSLWSQLNRRQMLRAAWRFSRDS